jgi:phosphate starvation-inducible PhoH-like protein
LRISPDPERTSRGTEEVRSPDLEIPANGEARLSVEDNAQALALFGRFDQNLRLIEGNFDVRIVARGHEAVISGPPSDVEKVKALLERLVGILDEGHQLSSRDVRYAIDLVKEGEGRERGIADLHSDVVVVTARGRPIKPKTLGQKTYVDAIRGNGLVFGIGPAGTGKTFLAVALAIAGFKEKRYNRIVLTRPAVEAGERLGFLPGDLQEKVDPYLRPLYDALWDILGLDTFEKYKERGMIEIAPLAYMRGRTLDDSFIILDEAQNTTPEQMKMFLTRMGFGSKAVVTGDITQIDLPRDRHSGLEEVRTVLKGIDGIEFVYLTDRDVVRHELVQKIVLAYEQFGQPPNRVEPRDRTQPSHRRAQPPGQPESTG